MRAKNAFFGIFFKVPTPLGGRDLNRSWAIRSFIAGALATLFLLTAACPPQPQPEEVWVTVCNETLLLPGPYCTDTGLHKFEKGKEPTEVCQVHKKPELAFEVFVSAYDFLGAEGDRIAFLRKVAEAGATGVRIFYLYAWPNAPVPSPWKQIATWKAGYNDAPDLPFFDLDQWNEAYWEDFRFYHKAMRDLGLAVYGVLHDDCSVRQGGWQKYLHPMLSSRPDRDPNDHEVNNLKGGFWGMGPQTIQEYHVRWFRRAVEELNAIGIEYYLEVSNEHSAQGWDDAHALAWHGWAVDELVGLGVAKEQIIACAMRPNWKDYAGQVGIYSKHGVVRPEGIVDVPDWPHDRIMWSGDGGFDGEGAADAKGRKGLSAAHAKEIRQKIVDLKFFGYEYLDRGLYFKSNDCAHLDDFYDEPLKRLADIN